MRGALRGDFITGALEDMYKRIWRRVSLSIGVPLGNLEGGSYTRDVER